MNQSKIIVRLLFITHQKFSKAIQMRMKHLDNPSACLKVRIVFLLFFLFTSGDNVRFIVTIGDSFLLSCVAGIKAKILRMLFGYFRTSEHDIVQCVFQ